MAENGEYQSKVEVWHSFMRLLVYGTIGVVVLLVLMAVFLL